MADKKELWENPTRATHFVLKYDRRGELVSEAVYPQKKVDLTPDERLMNSDRAADPHLDAFKNGSLVPVRLIDGNEDNQEIAENPNLKSESDLRNMYKLQAKKFSAEVAKITNSTTLTRLLEISDEVDATVKQVETVNARLEAVDPGALMAAQIERQAVDNDKPSGKPVTSS